LESKKLELEWQLKASKVDTVDLETVTLYVYKLRVPLSESLITAEIIIKSFVRQVSVIDDKAE